MFVYTQDDIYPFSHSVHSANNAVCVTRECYVQHGMLTLVRTLAPVIMRVNLNVSEVTSVTINYQVPYEAIIIRSRGYQSCVCFSSFFNARLE
jgi:hypothetical protein